MDEETFTLTVRRVESVENPYCAYLEFHSQREFNKTEDWLGFASPFFFVGRDRLRVAGYPERGVRAFLFCLLKLARYDENFKALETVIQTFVAEAEPNEQLSIDIPCAWLDHYYLSVERL